ncbi:hypothetical protein SAMD00024442_4_54 [Candidatus Symbiothrix dinenymphae]|nr:hypothetical protein SAMD00024442_4_54 [Candidatus Symbiothrix dinenymphae]
MISLFLAGTCVAAVAQEYKYEIGGAAGVANYMGDANMNDMFLNFNPAIGVVFRENLNFRWSMAADLLLGRVNGDTKNVKNVFPYDAQTSFERIFVELGGHIEFNFVPYSDKYEYLNTSPITPYIFAGLGLTYASGTDRFFGFQVPLGLGLRYKLMNRLNLGLEVAVHQLFSDDFDTPDKREKFNLNDPYKTSEGTFKNNDSYNTVLFTITWDIGLRTNGCCEP